MVSRPSWEARGARSRSSAAPPRPRPRPRRPVRLVGTKAAGSHAHKAASLSVPPTQHRRSKIPDPESHRRPAFPLKPAALTKDRAKVLTGICLLIEDCGLIIQPVPRRRRRQRQGRRRWASRGGGGGDAGGGGTRRPCSERPEERRRADRSPEPMRAPRRPCVTSPPLYSRRGVRTGSGQSQRGTPAARGVARGADITRGGRRRCEPVDEWHGVRAGP